jgi:hypothetical protein
VRDLTKIMQCKEKHNNLIMKILVFRAVGLAEVFHVQISMWKNFAKR